MIVIPMAGLSRRFTEMGYKLPKYMLTLGDETVFDRAVRSFSKYFRTEEFLFIVRDVCHTVEFVKERCEYLGIRSYDIAIISKPTDGQAETVNLGLDYLSVPNDMPLTIFNIDTFRKNFSYPQDSWFDSAAGYLEVFQGEGANWSYVRRSAAEEGLAIEVAEKRPISDLCCTGLYYFARAGDFRQALDEERFVRSAQELYVAPLYNHLIRLSKNIYYKKIELSEVIFCGVPAEYLGLGGEVA